MLSWITTSSLGTIEAGQPSEISVVSTQSLTVSEIKYSLNNGLLPPGLRFNRDGTISGTPNYNSTGTYSFEILARDIANSEITTQTFSISVIQTTENGYTSAYFQPLMTVEKRRTYRDFINNTEIFDPTLIYRPQDPSFGIQNKMKVVLDFGIERADISEYSYALLENFYKKRLRLGSVKSAIAKNSNGTPIYDVIYVEIVDELVNKDNVSADSIFYTDYNNEIYYPGSIDNMRKQLRSITLANYTAISVNEYLQPRFMLTQQPNDYRAETYMKVVPICYTLPGKSQIILTKIINSGFKFNLFDFEIDRIYIKNSLDNNADKYLIFDRQSLGNLVDTDQYLLGPEGWVRLDDESDQPLERE